MWQQFFDGIRKLILLQDQTDKNSADIKDLQRDVKALTAAIQQIAYEMRGNKNDVTHQGENIALRLQNELLKFERRLPFSN